MGHPDADLATMFANIARVSYYVMGPIQVDTPADEMLTALAPGGVADPDNGPPPVYTIPIWQDSPFTLVIAIVPLPKVTPAELQGVAITLQLAITADTTIPIAPLLGLSLDGTLDLTAPVAAVIRPDKPLALMMDPGGASAIVSGKGGAKLVVADPSAATRLLTIPGGSYLEVSQISFGAGVDATVSPVDMYVQGGLTGGKFVLDVSGADSFLSSILPSGGLTVNFDFGVEWSQHLGLRFSGGARLETTLAVNATLGPFTLGVDLRAARGRWIGDDARALRERRRGNRPDRGLGLTDRRIARARIPQREPGPGRPLARVQAADWLGDLDQRRADQWRRLHLA